jgi:Ca2+:H+ antiporter
MTASLRHTLTDRNTIVPVIAFVCLAAAWGRSLSSIILAGLGIVLAITVLSAVHHAEVVALKVGEPFGSLVLAVAVTTIEVGLIVTLMISSPDTTSTLARDAVFSAVMIATNGIVGISIVVATLKHYVTDFRSEGVIAAVATLGSLATLSLILPSFTTSGEEGTFSTPQLIFATIVSLGLYLLFVFVQTIRHRDYFQPPEIPGVTDKESLHPDPPTRNVAFLSFGFLLIALISVVGLAKTTSPVIESFVADAGLPIFVIAVSIALLVMLPESLAAVRAAARGRTQTSLNLAYGSGIAAIGLTIPTIGVLTLVFGFDVTLGLGPSSIVLLALTLIVSTLTIVQGRTTLMQGFLHLGIFATFLLLALNP